MTMHVTITGRFSNGLTVTRIYDDVRDIPEALARFDRDTRVLAVANETPRSTSLVFGFNPEAECSGCGEPWTPDDSLAQDPTRYCSIECERRDTAALRSRGER